MSARRAVSRFAALATGAAAVLSIGGVALAQASSDPTTYTACVSQSNGALRVVSAATDCHHSEFVITWGATGPVGPQGPQGEPGNLALAGQHCPNGQFVTGFDATGSLQCAAPPGTPVDADGDGFSPPADCDDTNAAVHPYAVEVLNGIDDDCDGTVDVVLVRYGISMGECVQGTMNALTGEIITPAQGPTPEVIDGLDNNCDGIVDNVS